MKQLSIRHFDAEVVENNAIKIKLKLNSSFSTEFKNKKILNITVLLHQIHLFNFKNSIL